MKKRKPKKHGSPCIYCGSVDPRVGREHVIPQGLGTFEQNWTLFEVCDTCNRRFGRELDIHMTRDSLEAFLRLDSRLKPASAASDLGHRRIKGSLRVSGPLDGSRVQMQATHDNEALMPVSIPQVGFRQTGKDWVFLAERELSKEAITAASGCEQVEVRVIAEAGDAERLRSKLADLGVTFVVHEQHLDIGLPESQVEVVFDFSVDRTIRRAAAKIIFNYTAKVLGAAAVRGNGFDRIREFIMSGTETEPLVVPIHWSPLEGQDATNSRAHTCAIEWVSENQSLAGIVCLFNEMTYGVRLLSGSTDEWRNVSSRHLFDPFSRKIVAIPVAD